MLARKTLRRKKRRRDRPVNKEKLENTLIALKPGIQYQPALKDGLDRKSLFFRNTKYRPPGPQTVFAGNSTGRSALEWGAVAAREKKPSALRRAWRRITGKGGRQRRSLRRKRRKIRRKTRKRGRRRKRSRKRVKLG